MATEPTTETPTPTIKTELLKEELVDKALKTFGGTLKGTVAEKAHILEGLYYKTCPKEQLLRCYNCNGVSDVNLDACPFCGQADEPSVETKEEVTSKASAPEPETTKPKTTKREDTKMTQATATEKATKTNGKATTTAIEKKTDATPTVSVKALDTAVKEVQTLKGEAGKSYWALGQKIREIYDQQLWKARVIDDGKAKYKSFNSFCEEELQISATHAYKMMDVSKAFTEKQVQSFGTSKLGLLLEAPPEHREQLMKQVEQGATKNKLKEKVKEARQKAGVTKRDTGRKATPKGKAPARKQVTLSTILGVSKTALMLNGAKPAKDGERPAVATKIAEKPWAFFDLTNDVRCIVAVTTDAQGRLKCAVQFKRIEAK